MFQRVYVSPSKHTFCHLLFAQRCAVRLSLGIVLIASLAFALVGHWLHTSCTHHHHGGELAVNPIDNIFAQQISIADEVCPPLISNNGVTTSMTGRAPGDLSYFSCSHEGYTLIGPHVVGCQPDGSWSEAAVNTHHSYLSSLPPAPLPTPVCVGWCLQNPCKNDAICTNLLDGFVCKCRPGWEGPYCADNVNDCVGDPCLNGGTCQDLLNGFGCRCPSGFAGSLCEINIDDCANNPCGDRGICQDLVNGYSCNCFPGYSGAHCETTISEVVQPQALASTPPERSVPLPPLSLAPSPVRTQNISPQQDYYENINSYKYCIIIPTVKRDGGAQYVGNLIHELLASMTVLEKLQVEINVFNAMENPADHTELNDISADEKRFINIVENPGGFSQLRGHLKEKYGDTQERIRWRSKEALDYQFALNYCQLRAPYTLFLEDDIKPAQHFVRSMNIFLQELQESNKDWQMVMLYNTPEYTSKRYNHGDVMKFECCTQATIFDNAKTTSLIEHLKSQYVEGPVDFLLREYLATRQGRQNGPIYIHKPNLFQHVGLLSTLAEKNKDKDAPGKRVAHISTSYVNHQIFPGDNDHNNPNS